MDDGSQTKKKLYREAVNQCCDPECEFGYGLLVHHILPLSKGGTDLFANYIVICGKCHWARGNHKADEIRMIELKTYKSFFENMIFGKSSIGMSDNKFKNVLRKHLHKIKLDDELIPQEVLEKLIVKHDDFRDA